MNYVDLVLRWIHILTAITLVGGTIFWRFALNPALGQLQSDQRDSIRGHILPKWAKLVGISSGLLLISGLINAVHGNIMRYDLPGAYHGMVAVKLLLALAMFFIAARLAGRSEGAKKFREKMTFWLNINVLLAVALVCIGGFMKMTPHNAKAADIEGSPVAIEEAK